MGQVGDFGTAASGDLLETMFNSISNPNEVLGEPLHKEDSPNLTDLKANSINTKPLRSRLFK